jgi:hypothetical protein
MAFKFKTQQKWHKIVLEQKASGLPPVEYCQKNNLCRGNFYSWRSRLGMVYEPQGTAVIPMPGTENLEPKNLTKGFMRLMPLAVELETIRIETPNGYKVSAGYIGEDSLKNVLQILMSL